MREVTIIWPFDTGILNLSLNLGLLTGVSVMDTMFALGSATTNTMTARPEALAAGMRIPSTDNQVPRFDLLCVVHCHHRTRVPPPRQGNSALNRKLSPRGIPEPPRLKLEPASKTFNETFNDREGHFDNPNTPGAELTVMEAFQFLLTNWMPRDVIADLTFEHPELVKPVDLPPTGPGLN